MVKIGNRDVVFATTLLLGDNEIASIDFMVEDWTFKMTVIFVNEESTDPATVDAEAVGDTLNLRFRRWNNPLGTALQSSLVVGTTPSRKHLEFMVYHHKVGSVNRLDCQFTTGAVG